MNENYDKTVADHAETEKSVVALAQLISVRAFSKMATVIFEPDADDVQANVTASAIAA